ncbi:hypothetical protein F5Y16DRAFT_252594 [Xylariaceae sp. FL0255]|nr:hypothetical protein F5Y16DRAFT_252594 [Xylariaceae sp. FL0255]
MNSEGEAVAQDFREALEDMQTIERAVITNLTIIARENLEHALEISGALMDHIKTAAPHKKLPPLYVLDSIVKNVGTPYTLFFSKKLYQTYMDSYSMVDMTTRRKLEEMLKTWKEPVPGSIDTRPVFPPDVVQPIENALMRVRATTQHQDQARMRAQQQLYGRGRPPQGVPYRETPTPPGGRPPSQTPGYPLQQPQRQTNGAPYHQPSAQSHMVSYFEWPQQGKAAADFVYQPGISSRLTPQPVASSAFQPPPAGVYGQAQQGISIDSLNNDIQRLIAAYKAQIAQNPLDSDMQKKLKAMVDLQTILQTQNLPQDQLVRVKNQIADLAVNMRARTAQTSTPVPPPNSVAVAPPPSAAAAKVSLDSLLGSGASGALAALMARSSANAQASIPQSAPATPVHVPLPVPPKVEPQQAGAPLATDPMALMNMLRAAGMIPQASGPTPVSTVTPPTTLPFSLPLAGLSKAMPAVPPPAPVGALTNDIALKASSLKQFRPHLLPLLFEAQGPQCTQCGRRFPTTEEGKKKKTAHMDWHFRVNQRSAETEKRGQHRSWLVDEMDWINTRETIDKDHVAQDNEINAAVGGSVAKTPKVQYLLVPDDPILAASVCPICQEKFEKRWLDDAQDFVWVDAIQVGDRIYHASCHREAYRDGGGTPMYQRSTPEPVLGKRKAEQDDLASALRNKIKVDAS